MQDLKAAQAVDEKKAESTTTEAASTEAPSLNSAAKTPGNSSHFKGELIKTIIMPDIYQLLAEFIEYFSEWRHAKVLIGTCMCWFLVDIAYVPSSQTLSNF